MGKCIYLECDQNQEDPYYSSFCSFHRFGGFFGDGVFYERYSILENAFNCLGALFIMHCVNDYSKKYLLKYSQEIPRISENKIVVENDGIKTPLDTKRYLFKFITNSKGKITEYNPEKNKRFRGKLRE